MADFLSERGQAFTGQEQPKSKPGQEAATLDTSVDNLKTPSVNIGQEQKFAVSGETCPIVFGKRVSDNGGVWVQPSLLKQTSERFVGRFVYAISQGEIASSPTKINAYVGRNCLAFIADQTLTLAHSYSTAAALASTPGSCPIQNSDSVFCGQESYTYFSPAITPTAGAVFTWKEPNLSTDYWDTRERNIGTTSTANAGISFKEARFDSTTGTDITQKYIDFLYADATSNIPTPNTIFTTNQNPLNDQAGQPYQLEANTIGDWLAYWKSEDPSDYPYGLSWYPVTQASVDDGFYSANMLTKFNLIASGRGAFTIKYTVQDPPQNNQVQLMNPATTGTITSNQFEYVVSNVKNPEDTSVGNNSDYADITFLKCNGDIIPLPSEGSFSSTTEQIYIYYEQGVKVDLYSAGLSSGSYTNAASNQFIDLAMYMFTLYKRTAGAATADIVAPVYLTNLQGLSTFCTTYGLTFNGVVSKAVNIVEFVSSLAPFYLLSFLSAGGQYRFSSVLPLTGANAIDATALTPTKTFTEADIIPGSFNKGYLSVEDRREFIASCVYRESNPGNIGKQKTLTVKYPATSIDAPTEQFDMSACCTNPNHAIIYAKYELARRKFSKHNISFSVPLLTTELIPTDIIKITRTRKSSTEDADRTETEWYQVTAINHSASGLTEINASHFPVNGSSISEISNEVLNGTFTVLS